MLMFLDPVSMAVAMSITVLSGAIVFVVDTFIRRDSTSGRIWAFGFFALGFAALGSLAEHSLAADVWVASAFGHACQVTFFGALWVGALRFNARPILWPGIIVSVLAIGVFVAAAIAAATGIAWLSQVSLSAVTAVLAGCGLVTMRRGRLARMETLLLSITLAVVVLLTSGSLVVRALSGWLGAPTGAFMPASILMALVSIPVTVVALSTLMVIREGERRGLTAPRDTSDLRLDEHGMLDSSSFEQTVAHQARRAAPRGEQIAVLAMAAIDLREIEAALGADAQHRLETRWRASWVHHMPLGAVPGEAGPGVLVVLLAPSTVGEANRIGNRLYGQVTEDLAMVEEVVLPMTGFGVAVSGTIPAAELIATARQAALDSATGDHAGHIVAYGDDIVERTMPPR